LLECQRMAQAKGRAFSVQSLPAKLTDLARLYGIDSLLRRA
jgi:phospholipid transport system transporter-binding protein